MKCQKLTTRREGVEILSKDPRFRQLPEEQRDIASDFSLLKCRATSEERPNCKAAVLEGPDANYGNKIVGSGYPGTFFRISVRSNIYR
jgi:hypothetical protein